LHPRVYQLEPGLSRQSQIPSHPPECAKDDALAFPH
jgi:hypothetical protein